MRKEYLAFFLSKSTALSLPWNFPENSDDVFVNIQPMIHL